MLKAIIATLAGLAIAAPASATSWADIKELEDLVTGTGTQIQKINCTEPLAQMGFYQFDKANNIDRLVYCKNNVDMTDPDAVWEVLVHEATHVMQSLLWRTCYEGHLSCPVCSVNCKKLLLTTMQHLSNTEATTNALRLKHSGWSYVHLRLLLTGCLPTAIKTNIT